MNGRGVSRERLFACLPSNRRRAVTDSPLLPRESREAGTAVPGGSPRPPPLETPG